MISLSLGKDDITKMSHGIALRSGLDDTNEAKSKLISEPHCRPNGSKERVCDNNTVRVCPWTNQLSQDIAAMSVFGVASLSIIE